MLSSKLVKDMKRNYLTLSRFFLLSTNSTFLSTTSLIIQVSYSTNGLDKNITDYTFLPK